VDNQKDKKLEDSREKMDNQKEKKKDFGEREGREMRIMVQKRNRRRKRSDYEVHISPHNYASSLSSKVHLCLLWTKIETNSSK
jgi:hypothetical protein